MPDQPSPLDDLKALHAKLVEERRKMIRDQIQHNRNAMTTGRELRDQGIVVATSETLLTDVGRRALDEASARVLETSRGERVQSIRGDGKP